MIHLEGVMKKQLKDSRASSDPVYVRWKQKHPQFPGVSECVRVLRLPGTTGSLVDIVIGELQDNAAQHASELIAAFQTEPNERIRHILMGILAEARLPEALPLLVEHLHSTDEQLQHWAAEGLRLLDTPMARKALWEAGHHIF